MEQSFLIRRYVNFFSLIVPTFLLSNLNPFLRIPPSLSRDELSKIHSLELGCSILYTRGKGTTKIQGCIETHHKLKGLIILRVYPYSRIQRIY